MSETVSFAGSGVVFANTYGAGVTDAYRAAVVAAENEFQSHFTDPVTVAIRFEFEPLDGAFSAHTNFNVVSVGYDQLVAALASHATTADDIAAVAGLPASDPSHGLGFWIATAQARVLGLAADGDALDATVILNRGMAFTFGRDAVGVLEHEISEGVFGRVSSLGLQQIAWQPMDLFRFDAHGQRDFTGGADGAASYFGVDGAHLSPLQFHNAIGPTGADDGFDLADWDRTTTDAFGPGGPASAGEMSPTDLQVLDILGWTPAPHAAAPTLAAESPETPHFSAMAFTMHQDWTFEA